ncbi:MAG: FctA domain-containing protein, partial [Tissierellia bacterium]|nr:FctA domain-containing protein [Tissierellia bacterium]
MKQKIFKRIVAFVLVLCIVFSNTPNKLVHAASHDNVVKKITLTKKDGGPIGNISQWQEFKVVVDFELPNNVVKQGDTTVIQLPNELDFADDVAIDIKDDGGNLVAVLTIDKPAKKAILTYTNYPETHSDVKGKFFFISRVDHIVVTEEKDIPLLFTVGTVVVVGPTIHYNGPGQVTPRDFQKIGWKAGGDDKTRLSYRVEINQNKKMMKDVRVVDVHEGHGIKIIKDNLKVLKGTWVVQPGGYGLDPATMKVVNHEVTISYNDDDSGFDIFIGDINPDEGYVIRYDVKTPYEPMNGEVFTNTATLTGSNIETLESISNYEYNIGGGIAEGYNFTIKLKKVGEQGETLPDAVFDVIRVRSNQKVGQITTGGDGYGQIDKLLRDKYKLVEVTAPDGYDLNPKEYFVEPADFNENKIAEIEVVNKKAIKPILVVLKATKILEGKDITTTEPFTFELYEGENPQPGTQPIQTVKNNQVNAPNNIVFAPIEFTAQQVGTHIYTIKEKKGDLPGVTYSEKIIKVTVNITLEGSQLKSQENYTENGTFLNNYVAKPACVTLKVCKELTGKQLTDGQFQFQLIDVDNANNIVETVTNDATGEARFSELKFETAGVRNYKIKEVNNNLPGITYDGKEVAVVITVTDNGEGQLVADTKYDGTANKPIFKNAYNTSPTKATIKAKKELVGMGLLVNMFEFELYEIVGGQDKFVEKVNNKADGEVVFTEIEYDKVGLRTYKIKEKAGVLGGVTYDATEFIAEVNVVDDGAGKLVATVRYPNIQTDVPVFNNIYKPKPVIVKIEAKKTLENKDLEADQFEFELKELELPLKRRGSEPVISKTKNDAEGNVIFTIGPFEETGFRVYELREIKGDLEGIIYDESKFRIEVMIYDNQQGELVAEVVYPNNEKPIFKNIYEPKSTIGTIAEIDGEKEAFVAGEITITDKVEYKKVIKGKEYTIKGVLMNKATNTPLLVSGKEVKAEKTFIPSEENGVVELEFKFDASELETTEVVVFEKLFKGDVEVTSHEDINDEAQTVIVRKPEIKTLAKVDGEKETFAIGEVIVTDTVSYKDLIVGKEYTVKGVLMNKA